MISPEPQQTRKGIRWKVRFRLARKPTSETFGSQADALKFCIDIDAYGPERAVQMLYDRLAAVDNGTPSLDHWVDTWLAEHGASEGTREKYRRNYRLHISPVLGSLPISAIDAGAAARLVRTLSEERNLSDKTVANVFTVLSSALDIAHKRGIISVNPCAETKMPRRTAHLKGDPTFLTHADFGRLRAQFDQLKPNGDLNPRRHFLPLIDFKAGTGARFGECAAITVRDLDFDGRVARINKSMRSNGKIGPPKTRRSNRLVTWPEEITGSLLAACEGKNPGELVFTMPRGGPLLSRTFSTRYWIPAVIAAGLVDPRPTPHSLRHSHASWLLQAGVDIVSVSRRLGHASIQVTVDTYGHLDPARQEHDAGVVGAVFRGAPALTVSSA